MKTYASDIRIECADCRMEISIYQSFYWGGKYFCDDCKDKILSLRHLTEVLEAKKPAEKQAV